MWQNKKFKFIASQRKKNHIRVFSLTSRLNKLIFITFQVIYSNYYFKLKYYENDDIYSVRYWLSNVIYVLTAVLWPTTYYVNNINKTIKI